MGDLLYDALMLGRNKKVEKEEYLVATEEKEAAAFEVIENSIEKGTVFTDQEYSLHLKQTVDGYLEIEIYCPDSLISFEKKVITSDEFADGEYEFTFHILSEKLHNGKNYSSISFSTSTQNIEIPIMINNKIRVHISDINIREQQIKLERNYLQLRMGSISSKEWAERGLEILTGITGDDEDSLYLMLYKAQIYLTMGDYDNARNNIEFVGTQIPKLKNKNFDLYCYFVYLTSLYGKETCTDNPAKPKSGDFPENDEADEVLEGESDQVNFYSNMTSLEKVNWVYARHQSWRILWVLFYMDPRFQNDRSRKLDELQKMFYQNGCNSPVMYLETLELYRTKPGLITNLGEFELQVLNFAVKNNFLNPALSDRVAELIINSDYASYTDAELKKAENALRCSFDNYPSGIILRALCGIIIANDDILTCNHKYFAQAIRDFIEIPGIYEYFIYTIDRSNMDPLPEKVMDFFADNADTLFEYRSYFYANLITNKYTYPEYYRANLGAMVRFAEEQICLGANDEFLAVIYKEILDNDLVTQAMKVNLFDIICYKEIICHNDRMKEVLVFHKELQVYQEGVFYDGRAAVKLYSADAVILFKNATGNLYHNIDYTVKNFLDTQGYIDICIKDVPINKYMLMGDFLPLLRAYKSPEEVLGFFSSNKIEGQFRPSYEQQIFQDVVHYYAKNSKEESVYDELLKFRDYDLAPETRGKIIDIMVERGMIEEAFDQVNDYTTNGMSPEGIAKLAHGCVELDEDTPNDMVLSLCEQSFGINGFDPLVFSYMNRFYNGNIDMLIDLYRTCNAYNLNAAGLEERILEKSMDTGSHPNIVSDIFRKYCDTSDNRKIIKDYLKYRAGIYLYQSMKGQLGNDGFSDMWFFDKIETEMLGGTVFDDEVLIAYLIYESADEHPKDFRIRNIEASLKDLVRRGKMLEEFKVYKRFFTLPAVLNNSIIVSRYSELSESNPKITYNIKSSHGDINSEEEMLEIFRYCYVKYFTLFYGEEVTFAIDGCKTEAVKYSDMKIEHDGSKYSELDEITMLKATGENDKLSEKVKTYFVRDKLIDRLF